ncbi:hypothetical protein [Olivibacter jilunii]|uniref:hypothetical protein n=1 Tax=Olivibacter jilunii TaxID=985016 RepID=UPI00102F374F|nr:hypothetical protein [Olivibacter jilunii]
MKTPRTFSPERLAKIRRMRKARRLWKQVPLFAFSLMAAEYPGYSHMAFLCDLRRRSPKKRRHAKAYLSRFGRYLRMQELAKRFKLEGNIEDGIKAQVLQKNMTKPYRLLTRTKDGSMEFLFSPLTPIVQIERLSQSLRNCRSNSEVESMVEAFRAKAPGIMK